MRGKLKPLRQNKGKLNLRSLNLQGYGDFKLFVKFVLSNSTLILFSFYKAQ